jgi:hypothetical protein
LQPVDQGDQPSDIEVDIALRHALAVERARWHDHSLESGRLQRLDRARRMIVFLAHFLIVLAAWTVTIKFLFPIAYAQAYGLPIGTHIYWDFWWVVHLWLAWALLRRPAYTFALAASVASVEIAIVVTKFALFLAAPEWTIWTTNWFINKLFVLLVFCLMLPYLVLHRRELQARQR